MNCTYVLVPKHSSISITKHTFIQWTHHAIRQTIASNNKRCHHWQSSSCWTCHQARGPWTITLDELCLKISSLKVFGVYADKKKKNIYIYIMYVYKQCTLQIGKTSIVMVVKNIAYSPPPPPSPNYIQNKTHSLEDQNGKCTYTWICTVKRFSGVRSPMNAD